MKKLMLVGLVLLGASWGVCAAESKGETKAKPHKPTEKELIQQFDRDGDGKLNGEERRAMKESIAAEKEAEKARIAEEKEAKRQAAAEARKAKKSSKK